MFGSIAVTTGASSIVFVTVFVSFPFTVATKDMSPLVAVTVTLKETTFSVSTSTFQDIFPSVTTPLSDILPSTNSVLSGILAETLILLNASSLFNVT